MIVMAPNRRIRHKRWDSELDVIMKTRKRGWWWKEGSGL